MEEKEKDVIAEQEKEEPVLEEAVESNPPEPAGEEKTGYRAETLCVEYEDIGLYGKALIPDGDGPFSTVPLCPRCRKRL